jgi:anti-sigma regulatory factor (Ser/Thr protein kinase)
MSSSDPATEAARGEAAVLAEAEASWADGDTAPILDQAFDAGTLYALRAAVQAHAIQLGLPETRTDDLVIAVHELAANAVRHGAGGGRVRLWEHDGALRVQVEDRGATPPDTRPDADVAAGWAFLPGHGLWLVRLVADELTVYSGPEGTRATMAFALPAAEPPSDPAGQNGQDG